MFGAAQAERNAEGRSLQGVSAPVSGQGFAIAAATFATDGKATHGAAAGSQCSAAKTIARPPR